MSNVALIQTSGVIHHTHALWMVEKSLVCRKGVIQNRVFSSDSVSELWCLYGSSRWVTGQWYWWWELGHSNTTECQGCMKWSLFLEIVTVWHFVVQILLVLYQPRPKCCLDLHACWQRSLPFATLNRTEHYAYAEFPQAAHFEEDLHQPSQFRFVGFERLWEATHYSWYIYLYSIKSCLSGKGWMH